MTPIGCSEPPPFFEADVPQDEVERILARIRQNLLLHAPDETVGEETDARRWGLPVSLPRLPEIAVHLKELRVLRDTFTAGMPARPAGVVAFLLNLPFRLFGRKQMRFDDQLLALLQAQLETLQAVEVYLRELAYAQQQALGLPEPPLDHGGDRNA